MNITGGARGREGKGTRAERQGGFLKLCSLNNQQPPQNLKGKRTAHFGKFPQKSDESRTLNER